MRFVKLTRPDGSEVWVNMTRVLTMWPRADGTGTVVEMNIPGDRVIVREGAQKIIDLANAVREVH